VNCMLLIYEHDTAPSKWWPRWDRKSVDDHGSTKSEDEASIYEGKY
jgi:hypothetical protein